MTMADVLEQAARIVRLADIVWRLDVLLEHIAPERRREFADTFALLCLVLDRLWRLAEASE